MIDLNHLKFTAESTKAKHGGNCAILVASGDVLDLLEMLESTKQDAARYAWLRDDSKEAPAGVGELYVTQHRLPHDEDGIDVDLFMGALDSTIDSAMAATKGEQA